MEQWTEKSVKNFTILRVEIVSQDPESDNTPATSDPKSLPTTCGRQHGQVGLWSAFGLIFWFDLRLCGLRSLDLSSCWARIRLEEDTWRLRSYQSPPVYTVCNAFAESDKWTGKRNQSFNRSFGCLIDRFDLVPTFILIQTCKIKRRVLNLTKNWCHTITDEFVKDELDKKLVPYWHRWIW